MILVLDPDASVEVMKITSDGQLAPYGAATQSPHGYTEYRGIRFSNWDGRVKLGSYDAERGVAHEAQEASVYEEMGKKLLKVLRFSSSGEVYLRNDPPVSDLGDEDFVPITPAPSTSGEARVPEASAEGKQSPPSVK